MKPRTAIVTGAASGIGFAIARRLALNGFFTVLLDVDKEAVEAAAKSLLTEGLLCSSSVCDLADTASVERAFSNLSEVHVLVNSAGIAHIGTSQSTSPSEFDRVYAVNVKGVYHAIHFALAKMPHHEDANIINICSIAAKVGIADRFAYSMSKGAVLAMTLSVARDNIANGIRCNCICPARIHTPFVDGFLEKNYPDQKEEMFKKLSAFQPIGRMGTSEEVADLSAFLVSSKANFITGASIDIDGGVINLR